MPQKIAIAIVHGIGVTPPDFADDMIAELKDRFARAANTDADAALAFQPIYWGPVLQKSEDELWTRLKQGGDLDFISLRRFMVSFAADALAYQPAVREKDKYEEVHTVYAQGLRALAGAAGPAAPLVVIAHSLGTIISSNYFYDLTRFNRLVAPRVRAAMNPSRQRGPLEKGETLTCLFTLGCPLALWSLRYDDFGAPLTVPPPQLAQRYPALAPLAGWENYYDPDDVIGYPLRPLNPAYAQAVARDAAVNVGSLLTSWNPLSHMGYWTDDDVTTPIADKLAALWGALS